MDHKKLTLAFIMTAGFALQVSAQTAEIQQLAQLNQSGQPQQAYAMAVPMLAEWEGEPAFDLQYGLAAVDSGMVSEGIFALERVLMSQPNNDYVRLEVGRAYFAVEEYDRARQEFERVLANNPPREVRENVLPYLDTIQARAGERRTTWAGYTEITAGHDTNINASPEDDSFFIPLLGGVATLSNSSNEDQFVRLAANGSVTKPIDQRSQVFSSVSLDHRANSSGDIDTSSIGLQFGYNHRLDTGNYRLGLQASQFRVENDKYRDLLGVTANYRHILTPRTSFNASAQYSALSYPDQRNKDADLILGTVGLQTQLAGQYRPVLTGSVSFGKELADNNTQASQANTEREILGASLGLRLSFTSALQLSTSIRAQESDYAGQEALFQRVREDINVTGAATLTWRASENWLVNLSGSVGKNDSNIPITDYSRNQISVGFRYLFR